MLNRWNFLKTGFYEGIKIVKIAAMLTPPHQTLLSRGPTTAVAALVDALVDKEEVPGVNGPAEAADEFAVETGTGERGPGVAGMQKEVARERLFVWDDGGPVSLSSWSGLTPSGVRINRVYTPPELRGRGYASACVAELSQLLLDCGSRFCALFTDLADPVANRVYARRIGYEQVADFAKYRFANREAT